MTKLVSRISFIDMYKRGGKSERNLDKEKGLEWVALMIYGKEYSTLSDKESSKVKYLWRNMGGQYRKLDSFKDFNTTKEEVKPKEEVKTSQEVKVSEINSNVQPFDYKKDDLYGIYKSFAGAFADARRHYGKPSPENTFIWNGNKYGVYYASEVPTSKTLIKDTEPAPPPIK